MKSFLDWWQHMPEQMNPIFFSIGSFAVHYYGLMYLISFTIAYLLCRYRIKHEKLGFELSQDNFHNVFSMCIFGLIVGARFGYVLFYNLPYYLRNPLEIILPFDIANGWKFTGFAGMSYHGGLIGAIISGGVYLRRHKINFRHYADFFLPCIPLGYTFGRLGNFINAELWGRRTQSAIGMYFPDAPGIELRHPSQLYEGFFEGIVLFVILWLLRGKNKVPGAMLCIYLLGYGIARFSIEYFREPDAHLGFIFLGFSMGQILSCIMISLSIGLYLLFRKHHQQEISQVR